MAPSVPSDPLSSIYRRQDAPPPHARRAHRHAEGDGGDPTGARGAGGGGDRFAFVTFTPALGPWYLEQVCAAGLDGRFAGIHAPEGRFADIASVAEDMRTVLAETCHVAAKSADVLILAGAPIAGLAPLIRDEVPAILIDPVQAAVLNAVGQWRLSPHGADRGSFARPQAKPSTGVEASLARWIARDTRDSGAPDPPA